VACPINTTYLPGLFPAKGHHRSPTTSHKPHGTASLPHWGHLPKAQPQMHLAGHQANGTKKKTPQPKIYTEPTISV